MCEPGVVVGGGLWNDLSKITNTNPFEPASAQQSWLRATTFDVDLGATRAIDLFHFHYLRTSLFGLVRIVAANVADFSSTVYDSDWFSAWADRTNPYSNIAFGTNWLPGPVEALEQTANGFNRYIVLDTTVAARYLRVRVVDPLAAEPCMIGHFGASEAWPVSIGAKADCRLDVVDGAAVETTSYGSTYVRPAAKCWRRWQIGFEQIPETEGLQRALSTAAFAGRSTPLVFAPWLNQPYEIERTAVYGLVSEATFDLSYYSQYAISYVVEELH